MYFRDGILYFFGEENRNLERYFWGGVTVERSDFLKVHCFEVLETPIHSQRSLRYLP